jgi:hypothetical protein
MKDNWEPNIGLAILREEKNKIHQFLRAYTRIALFLI